MGMRAKLYSVSLSFAIVSILLGGGRQPRVQTLKWGLPATLSRHPFCLEILFGHRNSLLGQVFSASMLYGSEKAVCVWNVVLYNSYLPVKAVARIVPAGFIQGFPSFIFLNTLPKTGPQVSIEEINSVRGQPSPWHLIIVGRLRVVPTVDCESFYSQCCHQSFVSYFIYYLQTAYGNT